MGLVDRTNEQIPLKIELPEGHYLGVDVDQDSSVWPEPWIWLDFDHEDEDREATSRRLTYEEAGLLHDRLGLLLGRSGTQKGPGA